MKTIGQGRERVDYAAVCSCQAQEKLVTRMKGAMIPMEFVDARFNAFRRVSPVQIKMYSAMMDYLNDNFGNLNATEQQRSSFGYLAVFGEQRLKEIKDSKQRTEMKKLHNNYGLGKTHLQIAAAKWLMKERSQDVLILSDNTFMDELSMAHGMDDKGETFNTMIGKAINASVLVWDDLGKAKQTKSRDGYYYRIIDGRYRARLPIIFSTNEDADTLAEKIGDAAASRLMGMAKGNLYAVEGEDQR